MMAARPLVVYIVDDDPAVRDSLSLLLSLRGYNTACFANAEDFLAAVSPGFAGCVIADVRMPGLSGLDMQQELNERGVAMPFIVITAHGTVATATRAFKANAVDFLEKPFDDDGPVQAVEAAFARERARLAQTELVDSRAHRLATLTDREREVADLLVQGLHHADIGRQLGISPRTVEVHKARVMTKLGAASIAELVRIAIDPARRGPP